MRSFTFHWVAPLAAGLSLFASAVAEAGGRRCRGRGSNNCCYASCVADATPSCRLQACADEDFRHQQGQVNSFTFSNVNLGFVPQVVVLTFWERGVSTPRLVGTLTDTLSDGDASFPTYSGTTLSVRGMIVGNVVPVGYESSVDIKVTVVDPSSGIPVPLPNTLRKCYTRLQ